VGEGVKEAGEQHENGQQAYDSIGHTKPQACKASTANVLL